MQGQKEKCIKGSFPEKMRRCNFHWAKFGKTIAGKQWVKHSLTHVMFSFICVFTLHSLSQLKLPGLFFRGLHPIAIGLTYDNHPSL